MGEMRKDSIIERFMIVSSGNGKSTNGKKSPYSPGNESMTNPSVLSLVAKDGNVFRIVRTIMLKVGQYEFLKVNIPRYLLKPKIPIVTNRTIASQLMGTTIS